jgi:hypothetical protein
MSEFQALIDSLKWLFKFLLVGAIVVACMGATASTASAGINMERVYNRTVAKAKKDCQNREISAEIGIKLIACIHSGSHPCKRDRQFPQNIATCDAYYLLERTIAGFTRYQSCTTRMIYVMTSEATSRRKVRWVCSSWGRMQG